MMIEYGDRKAEDLDKLFAAAFPGASIKALSYRCIRALSSEIQASIASFAASPAWSA